MQTTVHTYIPYPHMYVCWSHSLNMYTSFIIYVSENTMKHAGRRTVGCIVFLICKS